MSATGIYFAGTSLAHKVSPLGNCATRIDLVVKNDGIPALHITDEVQLSGTAAIPITSLLNDGQGGVKSGSQVPCLFGNADIGSHHYQIPELLVEEIVAESKKGGQLIDRDVEKPLNLLGMKVYRQHPAGPGHGDKVSYQTGCYRHPGLVFLIGARITVVGDYRAADYNKTFFEKGAVPGGYFYTDKWMSNADFKRLKEEMRDEHQGKAIW